MKRIAAIAISLATPASHAFGPEAHAVVGMVAAAHLSPKASAQVDAILAGESDASLAGVSSWADDVRPQRGDTAPFHYVNLEPGCHFAADSDCADGACVVGAIQSYASALSRSDIDAGSRSEALKFLVHFIGDVHQPLHASDRDDKGGNQYQVQFQGKGTNLHHVWDGPLITTLDPDSQHLASTLIVDPGRQIRFTQAGQFAPSAWAEESCKLIDTDGIYPQGHVLLADYASNHAQTIRSQLQKAGERLAAVLNAALDPTAADQLNSD